MPNVLDVLEAHGCFISDEDEADMDEFLNYRQEDGMGWDYADTAKRTCLCGTRINGFDEYHAHLREKIEESIS